MWRAGGHGGLKIKFVKCFRNACSLGNPDLGLLKVACLVHVISTFHSKWLPCLLILSDAFSVSMGSLKRLSSFTMFLWFCGWRCCSLCYSSFKQIPRGQIQLEFSSRGIKSIVSERRCILFPVRKRQVYLSGCLPYLLESLGLNLLLLCSHLFQSGIWKHTLFLAPSEDLVI